MRCDRPLIVLPAMAPGWAAGSICSIGPGADVLVIDNGPEPLAPDLAEGVYRYERPGRNLGVAASWNRGVELVLEQQRPWLIVLSEAVVFTDGGRAFLDQLDQAGDALCERHGWHLAAVRRHVFERVGRFDENLWPAYYEESDLIRRMACAGFGIDHCVVEGITDRGTAHCLELGVVDVEMGPLTAYYVAKWGGPPGSERYALPWRRRAIDHWPTPAHPR